MSWVSPLFFKNAVPFVITSTKLAIFMSIVCTTGCGLGFGCLLVLDYQRLQSSRYDLLPCFVSSSHEKVSNQQALKTLQVESTKPLSGERLETVLLQSMGVLDDESGESSDHHNLHLLDRGVRWYAWWTTSARVVYHIAVVVVFSVVYIVCIVGIITSLGNSTTFEQLFGYRGFSNTVDFVGRQRDSFGSTSLPVTIIIDPGVDYSDPVNQKSLDDLMHTLKTSQYTTGELKSWWLDFKNYLNATTHQPPANNQAALVAQIEFFLANPLFASIYSNDIVLQSSQANETIIHATTYIAYQYHPKPQREASDLMVSPPN